MAKLKDRFEKIARGEAVLGFDPLAASAPRLASIPLSDIQLDPSQPRKDLGDLHGLKASIEEHGIMQPLIVSPLDDTRFLLIAGERRFTAAKRLGLQTVPAIVRTVQDHERLELQLIENLHRKDLNPLEEAAGYKRLIDEFGLTQRELAKRVSKSAAVVNETLRILELPDPILESVRTSEQTSRSVLLEIVKEKDPKTQLSLWRQAEKGLLTVKNAREKKAKEPLAAPPKRARHELKTTKATVTVRFDTAEASDEDVRQALEEALLALMTA